MKVPDRRILELDDRMRLRDLTVLEIGCFEGIHTAALCHLAKRVLACDSRIENVVKTIVRCALFNAHPTVFRWNVEERPLDWFPIDADVLHHVGVLYHLTDPVGHLRILLPRIRKGLLIDTQLAPEDTTYDTYLSAGRPYRYVRYREAGREAPFAGMKDHAKWLLKQDLLDIVSEHGFTKIDVARLETERNGPRITLYAER
jgi:tRNA (mo5U34)-methyltransferase